MPCKRAIVLLSWCILVGVRAPAWAQLATPPQYVHEQWTIEDGLPVNAITDLVQTRDGYLWLSTFDGLVRFDGVHFTVFNMATREGLPSNRITELVEGEDGSLWMLTDQYDLVRFAEGRFRTYGPAQGVRGDQVSTLYKDHTGRLWVGSNRGVSYYQDGGFIPVLKSVPDQEIFAIHVDAQNVLWVGGEKGLHRLREGDATSWTSTDGLLADNVWAVFRDAEETVWIGAGHGVNVLRGDSLSRLDLEGESWLDRAHHVWFFDQPADPATIWIRTTHGFFHYRNGELQRFIEDRSDLHKPDVLQFGTRGGMLMSAGGHLYQNGHAILEGTSDIRTFLYDHEGSIWVASNEDGLHRLKPALFTVYSEPEGLADKNVYPLLEDQAGDIWFGARGVSRLSNGSITNYTTLDEIDFPYVRALFQDRAGTLWVGAWQGLCRFVGETCQPFGIAHGMRERQVEAIYEGSNGALWVGTTTGLFRYHRETWTTFIEEDGLSHAYVRFFLETQDGALWMATNGGGLTRYKDGRFDTFTTEQGLSSNLVRSLYEDEAGVLWVGTEGRGLCRIENHSATDLSEARVTVYRSADGLYDEVIHIILEDDFGRFWMSTNRGIFWVDRAQLNAFANGDIDLIPSTSYTERDGMRNREANGGMQASGIKARDGRLWFATQDGAVVVDPATIQRNDVPPPVVVEQVTVSDRVFSSPEKVRLAPGERNVEITYTALSFLAPENVRFRYILEGFADTWVEAGNRRTAYFTNVPPGDYAFRVIASNNDAVWNEEGAVLALSVAPFFYETTWFLSLCILGLVGLIAGTFQWRMRHLKKREAELATLVHARTQQLSEEKKKTEEQALRLQELDAAKSRFFANISHEFRTPLTLTIGPLEDLGAGLYGSLQPEANEQLDLALRNARRLQRLVNQILDVSKLEAGQMKLQVQQADLGAFLQRLGLIFTPAAERKRITFVVDVPPAPCLVCFDPDQLDKAVANLLSNAFKFTPEGGTVRMSLDQDDPQQKDRRVHVRVKDSGPGITAALQETIFERFFQVEKSEMQSGTGIGLSLARELVELHGGTLTVESEVGFGSTFSITLPMQEVDSSSYETKQAEALPLPATTAPYEEVLGLEAAPTDMSPAEVDLTDPDRTTVLVVDDNADIRAYVRHHLDARYRIVEASEGTAALAEAHRLLPDLIISDVMMPGMDGHALCRALKQDPEVDYIPVILLTAKATVEDKLEGLEEGADAYLTKPFNMDELVARVDNLIASRKRLRERFSQAPSLHVHDVEVPSAEDALLERVQAVIEVHIGDEAFTVEALAQAVGLSRGHLHRQLRALLDQSPQATIRTMRLQRAGQLLHQRAGLVSEIAYAVGFKSVAHFSTCFREHYGCTPTQYMAEHTADEAS